MEQAKRDLLMGSLMLVFGIAFFYLTYRFPDYGYNLAQQARAVGLGATFMPRLVFGALILESLFLIIFSLRDARGKVESEPQRLSPLLQSKPAIMFGAFVVYVYLATLVGFVISTIAFLAVCFYILGVHKVWLLIAVPLFLTVAIYYVFEVLLGAWLPSGSLF